MRRKILKNHADTLCHMFCGWELMNSWRDLEKIGTGTLTIDVLSGLCRHNSKPVDQIPMTRILQAWLLDRFAKHAVETDKIERVELVAKLDVSRPAEGSREVVCRIECTATIDTDETPYEGRIDDVETWESRHANQIRRA